MNRYRRITTVLVAILIATPLFAQQPARQPDSTLLTLDTVFTYRPKSLGPIEWQADGSGYLMLEPSRSIKDKLDIVRYDGATGEKTILVSAERLAPKSDQPPLDVEQFNLSPDGKRLLVFTKSA